MPKRNEIAKRDPAEPGAALQAMPEKELARLINDACEQADSFFGDAVQYALKAGRGLVEAKRRVAHGEWSDWLALNVPSLSDRRAREYMRLAKLVEERREIPKGMRSIEGAIAMLEDKPARGRHDRKPSDSGSKTAAGGRFDPPPVTDAEFTVHREVPPVALAAAPATPAPQLPAPAPAPVPIGALPPQADDPCEDCGSRYHATGDDVCPGAYADDEPPPAPADDYVDPDPRELAQHTLERHPLDPHAIFLLLYGSACPLPGFVSPHVLGRDVSHVQHVMALLREVWSQVDFKLEHKQFKNTEEHRLMAALRDRLGDCCTMAEEAVVRRHGQAADDQRRADVAAQKKRPAALEGARRG